MRDESACREARTRRRRGYTLVELMVVLGLISLMLLFLLPAILGSWTSAHRVQCQNNLKQLGLGSFNYMEEHQTFPPGYMTMIGPDGQELGPGWGWTARMLPMLEQGGVYRGIVFSQSVSAPIHAGLVSTRITATVCPSSRPLADVPVVVRDRDGKVLVSSLAPSSYVGSAGTAAASPGDAPPNDGVFIRNRPLGPDHVLDGMSHTLLIGERSRSLSEATWVGVVPGGWVCTNPDRPVRDCGPSDALVLGRTGPPGRRPAFHAPSARVDEFESQHGPGANFAFCDGSVRFVPQSIDPAVFRAQATRAGGELIHREPE